MWSTRSVRPKTDTQEGKSQEDGIKKMEGAEGAPDIHRSQLDEVAQGSELASGIATRTERSDGYETAQPAGPTERSQGFATNGAKGIPFRKVRGRGEWLAVFHRKKRMERAYIFLIYIS